MSRPELTVVGLDAATATIVDPLLANGELPTLRRLFEHGSRGTLRSTTPPLTSQAWATAFTGVNAGRHGLWEFVERAGTSYRLRLTNGSFRRAPAVWDYLTAAGRTVGVVNVPFTWPAQAVNGFMVAGLDAADAERGMTFPPELVEELGRADLDHRAPLARDGSIDLDQVRRAAESRVRTTLELARRFDPELLITVFMSADHALHYGWTEWEEKGPESRLAEVYRILDNATGELLDGLGAGTTLVLSDHGGGPLLGEINLNAWLEELGLLAYSHDAAKTATRRGLVRLAEQRKRLPEGLRYTVKQNAPWLRDRVRRMKDFSAIDWAHTRAFAYGSMGSVVINVRGRDELGIVEPGEEYDAIAAEITTRAPELRAPDTGEPVVAAVHRRDALFHGPEIERIPDLIVEMADYRYMAKGDLRRRSPVFRESVGRYGAPFVGSHRVDGIVGLSGEAARTGVAINAGLEDIAPTILYLLGEPVPLDLEGRVLEESIDPALLEQRPPEYHAPETIELAASRAYGAEETAEVAERLRGLGYLE
jgi:predicted AlkP superfamily phosphohydrolase/phosphomutase